MLSIKDNLHLQNVLNNVVNHERYSLPSETEFYALKLSNNIKSKKYYYIVTYETKQITTQFSQRISINGHYHFDILVYNVNYTIIKNDNNKKHTSEINGHTKYFGIKILDLFRLFNLSVQENSSQINLIDNEQVYDKILRTNDNIEEHTIYGYLTGYKIDPIDNKQNSKAICTIPIFANSVLLLNETISFYSCYGKLVEGEQVNYYDIINNFTKKIDEILIQNLLDAYYLITRDDKYEDIKFEEPRPLLDIFEEYYKDTQEYHILKKLVKTNDMPEMMFDSPRNFKDRDAKCIKIEYYDKIYLQSWNLDPKNFKKFAEVIKDKYKEKRDKNKQLFWPAYIKSNNWTRERAFRSNKKKRMQNIIAEQLMCEMEINSDSNNFDFDSSDEE